MFQEENKIKNLLLTGSLYIKQKEYWVKKLSEELTAATPLVKPGKNIATGETQQPEGKGREEAGIHISPGLSSALLKFSKNTDLSLYLILLTALESLIYYYTGDEDIVVRSPLYTPNITDDTLNHYLFIRQQRIGCLTFKELLLELRQTVFEAYENQDYPVDALIDFLFDSGQIRDKNVYPRIECLLENIHEFHDSDYEDLGDRLVFRFQHRNSQISGNILYNPALYEKYYFEQTARHFVTLLENALADINKCILEISFLSREEKHRLLCGFNNTGIEYKEKLLIQERLAEQVEKTPDRVALKGEIQLSYGKLNETANQRAHVLKQRGVGPDTIAGIMAARSVSMITAIWAVLKAGGGYLPIDPDYPVERIGYMIKDSQVNLLLTNSELVTPEIAGLVETIDLNKPETSTGNAKDGTNPEIVNKPGDLAYIIYTSGSTGKAKGVMVNYSNLLAYVDAFLQEFQPGANDVTILESSFSFDAFVEEAYPLLLRGGKICIAGKDDVIDIYLLKDFIVKNNVTLISCSPLLLNELNRLSHIQCVHTFISGADVLKGEYFNRISTFGRIYNLYGPTETTVGATYYQVPPEFNPNIPIGKPISGYQVYIINKNNRLQPIGIVGEIWIGGKGVTRGYLNRQELTWEKYVTYKQITTARNNKTLLRKMAGPGGNTTCLVEKSPTGRQRQPIYKSGDLGRWLPDGNIEFLGRIGDQVKIRGYRIELGEIESGLLNYPGIKKVGVIVREEERGDKYLCAYMVSDVPIEHAQIREYLAGILPDYMVPAYFVFLEELPLTPGGKIDRRALPAPGKVPAGEFIAPRDSVEERMADLWSDVLEINKELIGIDYNFFEIGGHSIKVTILIAKIHKEFQVKIPLAQIFKTPHIRGLSQYIKSAGKVAFTAVQSIELKEYYDLSHAQKRLWVLDRIEENQTAYNVPGYYEFRHLNRDAFERAIQALVKRHEILRSTFITINGEPGQKVHDFDSLDFKVKFLDWREEHDRHEKVKTLQQQERSTPFNLETGPLLRMILVHMAENRYLFLFTLHHIISDGWSLDILIREFKLLYDSFDKGENNPLTPLVIQYRDYSHWHNRQLSGEKLTTHKHYWLNRLKGEIPRLKLPFDFPRPRIKSFAGRSRQFFLNKEITGLLKRIARESGATLFMVCLTLVNVLLYRYTRQTDIIVGVPTAGREHHDLKNQIGFYINMVALRNQITKGQTFNELLQIVKQNTLADFEHQVYPFDRIVQELDLARDLSRNPLFDVVVTVLTEDNQDDQKMGTGNIENIGGNIEEENIDMGTGNMNTDGIGTGKHDLRFRFTDVGSGIIANIQYNPLLFKEEKIKIMNERLVGLIDSIITNVNEDIDNLSFLSEAEKKQVEDGDRFQGGF